MLLRVSPGDTEYGLHGLRVVGYNAACDSAGEDLAVAHGLWKAESHSRYARFRMVDVLNLSSGMVGEQQRYVDEAPGLVARPQPFVRGAVDRAVAAGATASEARVVNSPFASGVTVVGDSGGAGGGAGGEGTLRSPLVAQAVAPVSAAGSPTIGQRVASALGRRR